VDCLRRARVLAVPSFSVPFSSAFTTVEGCFSYSTMFLSYRFCSFFFVCGCLSSHSHPHSHQAIKRQSLVDGLFDGLGDLSAITQHLLQDVEHALDAIIPVDAATTAIDVDGLHAFHPPTASDQRGPCPALNALANHGYIPHNGSLYTQPKFEQTPDANVSFACQL
jgi:hypothetical protein